MLLVFRHEVVHAYADQAEGVFALGWHALHQGLRGAKQGVGVGQDGRVGQGAGDDAEIVGFQLEGYAFGFDVFSLDLPPQVFGKVGQVSACLFERQVFGQGDFGGDLEAFAFGFDGAFVRTACQIIKAVAVASEMV